MFKFLSKKDTSLKTELNSNQLEVFWLKHKWTICLYNQYSDNPSWARLDYIAITDGNKCGAINKRQDIVILVKYDDITAFNPYNLALIYTEKEGYNFIDRDGKLLNASSLYSIKNERYLTDNVEERKGKDTYIQVKDKFGKYGSINIKGKLIIPTIYEELEPFYKDKAIAKKDGKYGLINDKNEVVIQFKYNWIARHSDRYITISDNGLYGIDDSDGNEIFPMGYQDFFVSKAENQRILLKKNNLWAMFDYDGVQITDYLFDGIEKIWYRKHGLVSMSKDGKFGVVDKNGNIVLPFDYLKINHIYSENIIDVQISPRKCGLYNVKERCFVGEFESIGLLIDDDLISVKKGKGKAGIVNQLGEVVIPFEYYDIDYFPIVAKDNHAWGVIDISNNVVIPFTYANPGAVKDGYVDHPSLGKLRIVYGKNNLMGIINEEDTIVLPLEYNRVKNFGQFIAVEKDRKQGFIPCLL